MIVIGLTGRAGVGKSQVADHLVAEHGFTKLSFAGPLKKMLRTLDPIITDKGDRLSEVSSLLVHDTEAQLKLHFPEYRRLLQVLGTDCIRAVDEGFWVRAALAQLTEPDGRYVFDDVRFPNEAEAIRLLPPVQRNANSPGGRLWRVVRPDHDGGAGNHVSEQHADTMDVDRELNNVHSISYLWGQVDVYLGDVL